MFSFFFGNAFPKAKLAASTKHIAKGSNTNTIIKIRIFTVLSISHPEILLIYFSGPNSAATSELISVSNLSFSSTKIVESNFEISLLTLKYSSLAISNWVDNNCL